MGEPAIPPATDRRATRLLAVAIVDSVRNDEAMPGDVRDATILQDDTNRLVFRLAQEIELLTKERDAYAETFNLACRLQDADQCEDHSTGDDCPQGDVEHLFYEHLSKIRTEDERTDSIERGAKSRGPAVPSTRAHVTNDVDDCVSWCPACGENRSRGLNPDGSTRTA